MNKEIHVAQHEKKLTGWHALLYFLGFFGLMFAVNGVFLYSAITSFPGEDVPKSYAQGLAFNETLASRAAQRSLGWSAEIGVTGAKLVYRLTDADGAPISGAVVNATLRRPMTNEGDLQYCLEDVGRGEYQAELPDGFQGGWEVLVTATTASTGEVAFEARKTVVVP